METHQAREWRQPLAPLVPAEVGRVRFDAWKTLWLWGMLLPGALFGVRVLTPLTLGISLVLTFLTLCVGHSVGLHRGVIHRTYEAHPFTRGVLAYLFVLTGLGGPLSWARLHAVRDYWQNRSDCPPYFAYEHSLARDFVWNLHRRFVPADDRASARLPAGVLEDRWLLFLERTWPLHVLGLAALLWATLGPGAVLVCVCARTAGGVLGHWFIGYAAHAWGERRFVVAGAKESGTNVWALGVVSFGEGFHNNHHAFPRSARMGMAPGELDVGFWVIRALRALHLVWDVKAEESVASRGMTLQRE
jgi:stearoyl-CoA desaturase (delta-9 desaturase)